jgi:hypothetical protein
MDCKVWPSICRFCVVEPNFSHFLACVTYVIILQNLNTMHFLIINMSASILQFVNFKTCNQGAHDCLANSPVFFNREYIGPRMLKSFVSLIICVRVEFFGRCALNIMIFMKKILFLVFPAKTGSSGFSRQKFRKSGKNRKKCFKVTENYLTHHFVYKYTPVVLKHFQKQLLTWLFCFLKKPEV